VPATVEVAGMSAIPSSAGGDAGIAGAVGIAIRDGGVEPACRTVVEALATAVARFGTAVLVTLVASEERAATGRSPPGVVGVDTATDSMVSARTKLMSVPDFSGKASVRRTSAKARTA
jgi:hypothetical protein